MVRLKVDPEIHELCADEKFQFHNGSIKSGDDVAVFEYQTEFQFHNGSIKSITDITIRQAQ